MAEDKSGQPLPTAGRGPSNLSPGDDMLDQAFARLEAALSRLEQAATLKPQGGGEAADLREENAVLRDKVGDALRQLDGVLAELTSEGKDA